MDKIDLVVFCLFQEINKKFLLKNEVLQKMKERERCSISKLYDYKQKLVYKRLLSHHLNMNCFYIIHERNRYSEDLNKIFK